MISYKQANKQRKHNKNYKCNRYYVLRKSNRSFGGHNWNCPQPGTYI